MSLQQLLNESVQILEPVVVKDASGGADLASKPPMWTYIRARLEPTGSNLQVAWGTEVFVHTHTMYTMRSGIRPGYLVKDSRGTFLEVKGVKQHRGIQGMNTYYELGCQEAQK